MKDRHCIYLEPKLSERLETLANKPGATKSNVISDALRELLERQGADAVEERFKERLSQMTAQLNTIERDQTILLESFVLFVRHHLTVTPQLPVSQLADAQVTGTERFRTFIDEVGRRFAKGKSIGSEVARRAKALS